MVEIEAMRVMRLSLSSDLVNNELRLTVKLQVQLILWRFITTIAPCTLTQWNHINIHQSCFKRKQSETWSLRLIPQFSPDPRTHSDLKNINK